ncbi:MAG: manganese efflux pump [Clostridia bacterium]|nr:manganese efflux pump [Clostridia bacterium]
MNWDFSFFCTSIMLGAGLAMDAFSVSLANGLNEPKMKKGRLCGIAGVFALFQFAMPIIGWVCVHTVMQCFTAFGKLIPWIALGLLLFIGGKMLVEGIRGNDCANDECNCKKIGITALLVQGVATSIDALSVGFTIADYDLKMAVICALIIAVVTFFICVGGILIGRKFGTKLAGKAGIFGGTILILIGLEIFITGLF